MAHAPVAARPRVGVVKFASCDGCQLTLLDLEDELLAVVEHFEIIDFPEATSARSAGPYDVLFVEGSVSEPAHLERIVELRRCPIDPGQLVELLTALITGRRPQLRDESVCMECKRRGVVCVMVGKGIPCLGQVTQTGCGAICPRFGRGCYG